MASPCGILLLRNYIFMSGCGAVYGQGTTFFYQGKYFFFMIGQYNVMMFALYYAWIY